MAKSKDAARFINRLGEDAEFRLDIGPALVDLQEGDWSKVIKIAKESGYSFSKSELLAAVPDSFFKGKGKNPQAGWAEATRKVRKAKAVK